MYWGDYSEFLGQKVTALEHTKESIKLTTDKGTLVLNAYGDCCSESWFEHVDDDDIVGGKITAIEFNDDPTQPDIETKTDSGYTDGVVRFYAGMVKTTKGRLLFEMRNSSNGYYSGSLDIDYTEHAHE